MADDIARVFRDADQAGVRLALEETSIDTVRSDAVLFDAVQVPVVALAVIACIAGRRGGESVSALGARVGHALTSAFPSFARSGRYLQWSIRVRTVTVDAITFLEQSNIITVTVSDANRKASLTERGRRFIAKVRTADKDATKLYKTLEAAVERTRNSELRLI